MPQQPKLEKKKENTTLQQAPPLIDEKSPRFLFVDSLNSIEIIVSFSSLSKWYEQKLESVPERANKGKKAEVPEHDAVSVAESKKLIRLLTTPNTLLSCLIFSHPRLYTSSVRVSNGRTLFLEIISYWTTFAENTHNFN